MRTEAIEVVADPSIESGGHAIIRLRGIFEVPTNTDYAIEPLDGEGDAGAPGNWPTGARTPRDVKVGLQGVELSIGPDVVDAAGLQPGTPVLLRVSGANVQSELRWPNLPLSIGPITSVVMTPELWREALDRKVREYDKAVEAIAAGTGGTDGPLDRQLQLAIAHADASETTMPSVASAGDHAEADKPATVSAKPNTNVLATGFEEIAAAADVTSELSPSAAQSETPQARGPMTIASLDKRTRSETHLQRPRLLPIAAFASGIAATLFGVWIQSKTVTSEQAALSQGVSATSVANLLEALVPGPVSLQSHYAVPTDTSKALQLADENLSGVNRPVDRREAKLLLRRVVSASFGDSRSAVASASDKRMTWALTQLGTLYAAPDEGAPDFVTAKVLWEFAAAHGDPIAHCFLGTVYEHGLVEPADRRKALAQFIQAKDEGGCPEIETSIKRLGG